MRFAPVVRFSSYRKRLGFNATVTSLVKIHDVTHRVEAILLALLDNLLCYRKCDHRAYDQKNTQITRRRKPPSLPTPCSANLTSKKTFLKAFFLVPPVIRSRTKAVL